MTKFEKGTVLYGMMGAGKTTLGRGLAKHLGQRFRDTDEFIENISRRTCAEIIHDPEMDFMGWQSWAISLYDTREPEVIATGGSVATQPESVQHLARFGVGIFIEVAPDILEARLSPERIAALNNPKGLSFEELYAERAGLYTAASELTLKVARVESPEETLARLIELRTTV